MIYTHKQIQELDRVSRLKIINSITGIKPANLIGTIDDEGKTNLAIFSSVVHLGSNPPLLGFISRPRRLKFGHTYTNIQKTGQYTINHIHPEFIKKAHYTSAKFDSEVSEFERCKLTEEYLANFKAPFVKESNLKIGMCFKESLDIKNNGTIMVIGEVEQLIIPENAIVNNDIDLELTNSVGISGLNSYYTLKKVETHPYARVEQVPKF